MRAEQWVMLGVVGLGAYALYRIASARPGPQTTEQNKQPNGGTTTATLPDQRGAIAPAPPNIVLATGGDVNNPFQTIRLLSGRAYRGRGEGIVPADLTFLSYVQVYSFDQAKAAGFPDFSLTGASKNTRWFYGVYGPPSAPAPTTEITRPDRLDVMWETKYVPPGQGAQFPTSTIAGYPRFGSSPFALRLSGDRGNAIAIGRLSNSYAFYR